MNKSNIFGYLLGLLIFVIGIPALMWLVSGRPWLYVPDSVVQCVIAVLLLGDIFPNIRKIKNYEKDYRCYRFF
jgi:hypothetical protein